jgi:hypothetical protein
MAPSLPGMRSRLCKDADASETVTLNALNLQPGLKSKVKRNFASEAGGGKSKPTLLYRGYTFYPAY